MISLIFDTCFNKSYVLLKNNDVIVAEKIIESTKENYHSVYLIPTIRDILKEFSFQIKDLDVIATDIGPGSFTGIRVGLTIARVLAQQANCKLIGVNSLEILSCINSLSNQTVVALDARKNKVYFSLNKSMPVLLNKEDLLKYKSLEYSIITDSSISIYLKENGINSVNFEDGNFNIGRYLSGIVDEKLKNEVDNDFHWAKVKPLYIQPPSITMSKKSV